LAGIGKATALQYAADGCRRIGIADIQAALLQDVQSELKKQYPVLEVQLLQVDVTSLESVQRMVDDLVKRFGRIDYCANVAGIIRFGDTVNLPASSFDKVYEVNLRGIFFCCKTEIAQMLKQTPLATRYVPVVCTTRVIAHAFFQRFPIPSTGGYLQRLVPGWPHG
jgi:NAD(P)-dependent dehydrogenase (short-subunit alcohol dehydrogenase family)